MPRLAVFVRRFRALVRADPAGVRDGFVAHLLATATGLVAGLVLGSITGTLEALPGLLVLVPAAVGLRGNVFGALGSRCGTLVATGSFRLSRRRDTPVGQNLEASVALSLGMSLLLAVVAKAVAEAFGVQNSISVADFIVVSVVGALVPTAVVLAITVTIAAMGVRREWDVDNVSVPVVTAAGDVVTLPSLFLATYLIRDVPGWLPELLAVFCTAGGLAVLIVPLRSHLTILRRIVGESIPFLLVAGLVSTLAGITIQSRLGALSAEPALLIVIPPLLSLSGSLAGILSARLATKLHLGVIDPSRVAVGPVARRFDARVSDRGADLSRVGDRGRHPRCDHGTRKSRGMADDRGGHARGDAGNRTDLRHGLWRGSRDLPPRVGSRQQRRPHGVVDLRLLGGCILHGGAGYPWALLAEPPNNRLLMGDDRPPRNLKAMLSEAKDTSELMVDLAYAALFFDDEAMAAEVDELEERLRDLVHEMREICVLAARSPREAEQMSSVLHLVSAIERTRRTPRSTSSAS